MREFIKNNIKLVSILIIVIVLAGIGITYAALTRRINVGITTGEYNVVYEGISTLPSSDLSPVPDSSVRLETNKVLKVEFTVKGAQTNPIDKPIIYDVSLTDLDLPEELKNSNFKWRLYKNNTLISEGLFSDGYDPEDNTRMVLTYTQQDLPSYDETADSYVFYAWLSISEACASDITNCTEEEANYSKNFMNKTLSGNIRIELSTGEKITRVLGKAGETITRLGLEDSIKTDTPSIKNTSCSSGCGESTVGIYRTVDDLGISYYFRGDVTNNYVKFAGLYWRIIRINGDGTIRMIYDGTEPHENGTVSEDRVLKDPVRYNNYAEDVSFVGYMNGTIDGEYFPNGTKNSTSKTEARANISDSTIKMYVDTWYENNIIDYEQHVADAIYCNERSVSTLKTKGNGSSAGVNTGFGDNVTIFAFYDKNDRQSETSKTYKPDLLCKNKNDRFTTETEIGNGKLKYPIGLLNMNEALMAGLSTSSSKSNNEFYLYTGYDYWTMSPQEYLPKSDNIFSSSGTQLYGGFILLLRGTGSGWGTRGFQYDDLYGLSYLKPVISIKPETIKYGTGTTIDPFRITEEI